MVNTLLKTETDEKTANGRFFYANKPGGFHKFSVRFWLNNNDVLPEGHGLVLQAGIDQSGKIHRLNDSTEKRAQDPTVSLFFDARRRNRGQFLWHLIHAQPYGGRTVAQITTNPNTTPTVINNEFNAQGRLMKSNATFSPDYQTAIIDRVIALAEHELVIGAVAEMRARRHAGEEELRKLVVEGISTLGVKRYEQEIESRQNQIDNIGFIALKPQELT